MQAVAAALDAVFEYVTHIEIAPKTWDSPTLADRIAISRGCRFGFVLDLHCSMAPKPPEARVPRLMAITKTLALQVRVSGSVFSQIGARVKRLESASADTFFDGGRGAGCARQESFGLS